jgi:hypothetical protein
MLRGLEPLVNPHRDRREVSSLTCLCVVRLLVLFTPSSESDVEDAIAVLRDSIGLAIEGKADEAAVRGSAGASRQGLEAAPGRAS